jgi:transcriptional regulator with XRE-family HTH domain
MKNAEEAKKVLGRRIALFRKRAGLTQAELAEKLEVSDNFIGQIERGLKAPSFGNLVRIVNIFKIEIGDLFAIQNSQLRELPGDLGREIDDLILFLKDRSRADIRFLKKIGKLIFQEYPRKI